MIRIISGAETRQHPELFRQVHALRHRVFVDEMHWEELRSPDGLEIDRYDDPHAMHHLALREVGGELQVAGYQRMLPTTRPHLLSRELAHLCAEGAPSGPGVWEVTRYCVAPAFREGRRAVGTVGSELLAATVEWAVECHVTSLLYAFEASWIGRAVQLGFRVRSLGFPAQIENQTVVAAELIHGPRTLETIRAYRKHHNPVIEFVGSLARAPLSAWAS